MLDFLNLPDIVLEKILSNLSYDDIARYRIVCRHFNTICKQQLNKGFILVEKYHAQCLKAVKTQLPRRESERRSHPLARHCDILTAVETRLSMLAMTFTKYIDAGLCCFIPGKVIDEIFRVLRSLKKSETPPRAHEVLQELRDISSMAMEHFDEKIVPGLKLSLVSSSAQSPYTLPGNCIMSGTPSPRMLGQEKLRLEFSKIHSRTKRNKASVGCLKKSVGSLRLKLKRYGAQITVQGGKIREQETKIEEQDKKITEQESQIAELKRHFEEWDHKFGDLTAELSRAREETGTIAEPGSSHEVEGRVARQIIPVGSTEHVLEKEKNRRKKISTNDDGPPCKRSAPTLSCDLVTDQQIESVENKSKAVKRKSSVSTSGVNLKKSRKAVLIQD